MIKRLVGDDNNYEHFMERCLKKSKVVERMKKVYTNKDTQQLQEFDGNDIKQRVYLHAEMNILSLIIDKQIKNRVFIAVSKRCCYLCGLYIQF